MGTTIREKLKIFTPLIAFLVILTLFFAFIWVRFYNDRSQILYNGRYYRLSSRPVDGSDTEYINAAKDTWIKVKGMNVYDANLGSEYASTVIYLKTQEGTYLCYSLVGGP